MKKFQVENSIMNAGQTAGYAPHDEMLNDYIGCEIEAETAEEAIEFAMDYLFEQATQNGYSEIERNDREITISEDGEPVEKYYNFVATEVE